ncbi:hypothetical protein [Rubinisphaera italica]|nr:hypothetical protein [Rubinisphaera italica]
MVPDSLLQNWVVDLKTALDRPEIKPELLILSGQVYRASLLNSTAENHQTLLNEASNRIQQTAGFIDQAWLSYRPSENWYQDVSLFYEQVDRGRIDSLRQTYEAQRLVESLDAAELVWAWSEELEQLQADWREQLDEAADWLIHHASVFGPVSSLAKVWTPEDEFALQFLPANWSATLQKYTALLKVLEDEEQTPPANMNFEPFTLTTRDTRNRWLPDVPKPERLAAAGGNRRKKLPLLIWRSDFGQAVIDIPAEPHADQPVLMLLKDTHHQPLSGVSIVLAGLRGLSDNQGIVQFLYEEIYDIQTWIDLLYVDGRPWNAEFDIVQFQQIFAE